MIVQQAYHKIIEFYGLPGAGKTTMAQRLAAKSDFKIVKIRNKRELFWYNFLFLIRHPVRFFATIVYLIANSTSWPIFYYKFINTFLHHNAKYQKALRGERAILDQGYFQNILSVFEEPIGIDFLLKYSKFLLKPGKLIILNLPADDVSRRIGERGYMAREKFGQKYFRKWLGAVKENNRIFLENLDKLGIDYTIVDARQGADVNCDKILNILKNETDLHY
jgi:deoxyadenosine/deoxycytidine kinase